MPMPLSVYGKMLASEPAMIAVVSSICWTLLCSECRADAGSGGFNYVYVCVICLEEIQLLHH